MVRDRYWVQLAEEEQERLTQLVRSGRSSARIIARARILLKVDEGGNAPQISAALDVFEGAVVYRIKRRYREEGLDGVLQDRVQANRFRKLDEWAEPTDCPGARSGP